jgi:hypothetical protein
MVCKTSRVCWLCEGHGAKKIKIMQGNSSDTFIAVTPKGCAIRECHATFKRKKRKKIRNDEEMNYKLRKEMRKKLKEKRMEFVQGWGNNGSRNRYEKYRNGLSSLLKS